MTTTNDPPHALPETHGNSSTASPARPEPNDPEHDIDARSTTIWVILSTLVLYAALYFMVPVFDRVMTEERIKKINERPALEFDEVWEAEEAFLNGELSDSKKTIEQIMVEMVNK